MWFFFFLELPVPSHCSPILILESLGNSIARMTHRFIELFKCKSAIIFTFLSFCCYVLLGGGDKVICSPGWPQTSCVTEDDLLIILLHLLNDALRGVFYYAWLCYFILYCDEFAGFHVTGFNSWGYKIMLTTIFK